MLTILKQYCDKSDKKWYGINPLFAMSKMVKHTLKILQHLLQDF